MSPQVNVEQAVTAAPAVGGMKKISRGARTFPLLFCACFAGVVAIVVANGVSQVPRPFLVLLCATPLIGYVGWKFSARNLADEVYDCGDSLLVRKGGEEVMVPLSEIAGVRFVAHDRNGVSGRIILTLAAPRAFGSEIQFAPPLQVYTSFPPKNDLAEHLTFRAAEARAARTGRSY